MQVKDVNRSENAPEPWDPNKRKHSKPALKPVYCRVKNI